MAPFASLHVRRALEPFSCNLSITTFRYRPPVLPPMAATDPDRYLSDLNRALLARLHAGGRYYPTHAVLDGKFVLRSCIVNFRTGTAEVRGLIDEVVRLGRELSALA